MLKYRPAPSLEGQEVEIKFSHEHASLTNPHYCVWKVSFPFGDKLYYDWEYDVLSLKGEFLGVAWERMMLRSRHPEFRLIAA